MAATPCPECANGKHANCTGWAIDETTDEVVCCGCSHAARSREDAVRDAAARLRETGDQVLLGRIEEYERNRDAQTAMPRFSCSCGHARPEDCPHDDIRVGP